MKIRSLALSACLFFSFLSASNKAAALDVESAFNVLGKVPADFFDFGSVCEQLARLQLYTKYNSNEYRVDSGIVYTNSHGSTIGELDVVVFHKQTGHAVVVGEVKCWRDLGSAMKKAKRQLARFADTLKTGRPIHMYNDDNQNIRYQSNQFKNHPMRSIYISQNGGEQYGFHMSIGLSHEEVQQVRTLLLRCQKAGKCARPRHY